jgi:hypothetical protein
MLTATAQISRISREWLKIKLHQGYPCRQMVSTIEIRTTNGRKALCGAAFIEWFTYFELESRPGFICQLLRRNND